VSTSVRLTDFEFEDTYRPIRATNGSWRDFSWGGPNDLAAIQQADQQRRLWTIIDFDGIVGLGSGNHFVNRLGYVITEVSVPDNVIIDVIDDDDFQELERQSEISTASS
jgi:hypothetical protein